MRVYVCVCECVCEQIQRILINLKTADEGKETSLQLLLMFKKLPFVVYIHR